MFCLLKNVALDVLGDCEVCQIDYHDYSLESLLHRRVKTDLVMCYKILHNLVNINCAFFQRSTLSYTRGNVTNLINHELSPLVTVPSLLIAL